MDWLTMKSGSDVRGTAVGEDAVLTGNIAYALGAAFVRKLCSEKEKKPEEIQISLGRDSRITGPALLKSAAEGICSAGATAIDFGMCTTPAMFMSTVELGVDGAIQITASHHPFFRNGLKFFTREGGAEGSDIAAILSAADKKEYDDTKSGTVENVDFMPRYAEILRDIIKKGVNQWVTPFLFISPLNEQHE